MAIDYRATSSGVLIPSNLFPYSDFGVTAHREVEWRVSPLERLRFNYLLGLGPDGVHSVRTSRGGALTTIAKSPQGAAIVVNDVLAAGASSTHRASDYSTNPDAKIVALYVSVTAQPVSVFVSCDGVIFTVLPNTIIAQIATATLLNATGVVAYKFTNNNAGPSTVTATGVVSDY